MSSAARAARHPASAAPRLPGFWFPGSVTEPGWGSRRIAAALAELMRRLGYDRHGAQGGDFGAFVAPDLGRADPDHVIGVHVNAATMGFIPFGGIPEAEQATLSPAERERVQRLGNFMTEGNGYFQVQATRPQTLSCALTDSPAGSSHGSWRSSRNGRTPVTSSPSMRSPATTSSPTSASTGSPRPQGQQRTSPITRACTATTGRPPRRRAVITCPGGPPLRTMNHYLTGNRPRRQPGPGSHWRAAPAGASRHR